MATRTPRRRTTSTPARQSRMKAASVEQYLSRVSDQQRGALERIRKAVREVAPRAEECISYGLPAFRLDGRPLVAYGASAGHCAFYPMSGETIAQHSDLLGAYETSKGTIRFDPGKPLPPGLVKRLVRARIRENAERS